MKRGYKLIASLIFLILVLTGCNSGSSSNSSEGDSSPVVRDSFTITWENYDGTVLEIDEKVPAGVTPSYDGSIPKRDSAKNYSYTFNGWYPEIQTVRNDAVYIAEYISTLSAAYVSFDLNGGITNSNSQSRYISAIEAENFFFDVTKENYNFRGWEYNGKRIFDGKGNKINSVDIAETMTFKALFAQTANLTVSSNLKEAGTITGEGEYSYNTVVKLNVVVNEGYKFIGWYYEDETLISNQTLCPFMIWDEDVTILAKFDYESYRLHVQSYNDTLGLVLIQGMGQTHANEQEAQIKYQSKVIIDAYTSTGIEFLGWFDESDILLETKTVYEFVMPHRDYRIIAKWNSFRLELSSSDSSLGTVNNVSGDYSLNETINLIATLNEGSEFVGWYLNNETLISTNANHQFSMPCQNVSITARFKLKIFNVNVYTTSPSKGSVSGGGDFEYGSEVTLTATPTEDYFFKGWYLNGELISKNNPYTFTIGNADLLIEGRFAGTIYTIHFETNGGDPIQDLVAEIGDLISVNPTRKGFTFDGWYTDASLSSTTYFELGNTMPAYNGTLYAKWSLVTYTITYHLDIRTTNNPSNPTNYNVLTETITLLNPTVSHGEFNGWYSDSEFNNPIHQILKGSVGDIDIYAKETAVIYTITFVTNGGNPISPISGGYGDSVVLPTPIKDNFVFTGWFTDPTLTNKADINAIPGENITLYAKWIEMYTVFEIDSKQYMYFGSYPQSVVSDSTLKTELFKIASTNERGYYEYDGNEYAKTLVKADNYGYTYANGSPVIEQTIEFFKVEPILWRVLISYSSYKYMLLTEQAINAHLYAPSSNNYMKSEIRSWINDEFYNVAFKSTEKNSILTTNVDNSASTTNSDKNPYACENTNDNVFLLSYRECCFRSYGLSTNADRICKPTDYAIANTCEMFTGRTCKYWTRSPVSSNYGHPWYVDSGGERSGLFAWINSIGVRPALNINLK